LPQEDDLSSNEEIFLDAPAMSAGHQIFQVRGWTMARNNDLLAVGIDTAGGRRSTLYVKDLAAEKMLPEIISNTSANYAWSSDSKTLFYVLNDHTVRPYKLMKHEIGTDPKMDKTIYTENE
jgi:oligopeptidase B